MLRFCVLVVFAIVSTEVAFAQKPDAGRLRYTPWHKACPKPDSCFTARTSLDTSTGTVSAISLMTVNNEPVLRVSLPDIFPQRQEIKVDVDQDHATLHHTNCQQKLCMYEIGLLPASVEKLRKGKAIAVRAVDGKSLSYTYSLAGFAAAMDGSAVAMSVFTEEEKQLREGRVTQRTGMANDRSKGMLTRSEDPAGIWEDGGPFKITNKPECVKAGIRVVGVREGALNGLGALFLQVFNTSGQRRTIQADVKFEYQPDGNINMGITTGWETTQPFTLRGDEREGFQVVKQLDAPHAARITDINVLGCSQ